MEASRSHPSSAASALRFALKFLSREWRSGELRALAASLVIAVGSLTSVGFFAERIERGMASNASELLAADMQIVSSVRVADEVESQARSLGLNTSRLLTFRSVLTVGDEFQLAAVKAVDTQYPLRGQLVTSDAPFADGSPTQDVPPRGTVWLDARLLSTLNVKVGQTINLGASAFRIDRVLTTEPDRGGDMFNIAPRLMLNLDDIPATELVQPGSRVRHRLLVAGDRTEVARFTDSVKDALKPGQSLRTLDDGRPEMRAALIRAQQFLGLASLVAVLLAGVAIAVAAGRYATRHLASVALYRCLGAKRSWVLWLHLWELLGLGLLGCMLGVALGFGAQQVLAHLLSSLIVGELPAPGFRPALAGMGFGLVTLLGFSLPPLLSLGRVSPMRVLKHDLPAPRANTVLAYLCASAALVGIAYWFANDATLTVYVIGGGALTMLVLLAAAWLLVRALSPLRDSVGVAWRFGFANIARRGGASHIQIVAFGLGIMALMLLAFVRGDLLNAWQNSLPPDTPNYFLVNVQPHEAAQVETFLAGNGVTEVQTFPMIRARLKSVNDVAMDPKRYADPRAQRLAGREFNLSHSQSPSPGNRIIAGQWWSSNAPSGEYSVEAGIARTLGIELGDTLEFEIAGEVARGSVSNLRQVNWETFDVNFFVVGSTSLLADYPATHVASFYLPSDRRGALVELIRQFPSVTVVEIGPLLEKVKQIMDHATRGVEFVFLFTLAAGVCVLYAAIESTLDARRYETALLRTIGANRFKLWCGILAEFATLGLLSGLLAAGAASAIGGFLAWKLFDLTYTPNLTIWLVGLPLSVFGVLVAGWLGTRSVIDQPPMTTLRNH
ncbi:MAG: ABC transporter permease [Gammaproteobacteria bacterium]|nr:ABC transporter permease [Gammaproteobacteria bacterium]